MIPYQLPSSVELADATIKELADYDVVMWEKHGIFAVDRDVMAAFDQIDVLNKSALIYIAAKRNNLFAFLSLCRFSESVFAKDSQKEYSLF